MATYKILSMDGGGIRGVITAIILQRLKGEPALSGWLDRVELLAGTSTGGLLALGLAFGRTPEEMREIYETRGQEIFDDSWLDDLTDLGRLMGAQYDNTKLRSVLQDTFGQTRLADLNRRILVTAYDLDNESSEPTARMWKPKLFHNFPGPDSDGEQLAWKVALYTSAAPTYFPSVDGYIDGGVYATNPSMCALAQALDSRGTVPPALEDIVLLSLGTGTSLLHIEGQDLDWGYAQWAKPLVNLMLDGTAGIADYQCRQILGSRYHRLAPVFPPGVSIPMDGVDRIPDMVRFAEGLDLSETVRWLSLHWF